MMKKIAVAGALLHDDVLRRWLDVAMPDRHGLPADSGRGAAAPAHLRERVDLRA